MSGPLTCSACPELDAGAVQHSMSPSPCTRMHFVVVCVCVYVCMATRQGHIGHVMHAVQEVKPKKEAKPKAAKAKKEAPKASAIGVVHWRVALLVLQEAFLFAACLPITMCVRA